MNELVALLLGVVQGLTEFLPVSSSGHLELAKALFQADFVAKREPLFTITLHGATALSTLVFFRKDIGFIFKELLTFKPSPSFLFFLTHYHFYDSCCYCGAFFRRFNHPTL